MYDIIIIGGGPAGVAAGVYAARKKMKTAIIAESFGGQSLVSTEIQNWIGSKAISGLELAQNLEAHMRAQEGVDIIDGDLVENIKEIKGGFTVGTKEGKIFETKTVLICSGSRRRTLGVKGEKEFDGKGVAYCSTCDAPLFGGKIVAVVGAGNAGLEAVHDMLAYAPKVYLFVRGETIKGDPITFAKIKGDNRVEIFYNAEVQEIFGDTFVKGLKYADKKSGATKTLDLAGVFIEIGSLPNVEFMGELVKKNKFNEIEIDFTTQQTSCEGIWAAGDVTSVRYKQNNISAGDAIKAILNIQEHLNKNK
ncbi:MAG: FAD-dependent oxidoreductase [bacterium]|nr:FAD-dependent oxidoreductase [bacterium]